MKLRERLNRQQLKKIPPGWMTGEAMAKREGFSSVESFKSLLYRAMDAGMVEVKKFKVINGNGLRNVPHYRYK